MADLRIHPDEIPSDLIQQFIPHALGLNTSKPAVAHLLRALAKRLAECLSVHAAATELMEHHPWDFCTVYYEAIDQIGHDFMVYHPPKMRHLPDDVFFAFQNVMNAVYELHDKLLGRLLELAGADAHVLIVSDHGFLSGDRRPSEVVEAARWHRNFGIIAARGEGLKRDALVQGATLLDVAPTILTLFGVPIARDMEGKVLVNAFERMPQIERVDSWESVHDPNAPSVEVSPADDPEVAAEAMRQLVELGYLAAPGEDVLRDLARARAEQRFNLAASLMEGRRAADALPITAGLMREFPDEIRHAILHGQAAVPAGDAAALEQAIEAVQRLMPDNRHLELFRGFLASFRGDDQATLRHFQAAGERTPDDAWVHCRVGRAYLRLRRWADAEAAFRRSEQLDPESAEAAYGLSVAVARLGRPEEAVEHGLRAVGQLHDFPLAHFQLGAVLSRLSQYERAAQAFEICIAMRPQFALAYRYLSRIYLQLGRVLEARDARDMASRLIAANVPQPHVE
jgi:tetratricopeptide (TPR) repeat protein